MGFAIEMTPSGVLLASKWRMADELKKMTKEDVRNTLIVELSEHSNQPAEYFQNFDDNALVGKGATVVLLMEAGIRDSNALKNMSDDDQRNTLIVENGSHTDKTNPEMWKMSDQQLVQLGLEWLAERRFHQWQKDNWETIKNKRLWQIALPATHDSGCYAKRWMGAVGAAGRDYSPRSQTQGATIYEQLTYGMRHFDLRFRKCLNGTYYIMHGKDIFETTLDTVLSDIKKFLNETEKEIIILQFHFESVFFLEEHGEPIKGELGQKEVIEAIGKDFILTHDDVTALGRVWPANCTPEGLIGCRKRVILLWVNTQGKDDDDVSKYIWSSKDANEYIQITQTGNYGSAFTTDELIEGRTRDLEWWQHNYRNIYFPSSGKYWFGLGVHLTTLIDPGDIHPHDDHEHWHGT